MQGPDRKKMLAVWEENLQKISGGTTSTDKVSKKNWRELYLDIF